MHAHTHTHTHTPTRLHRRAGTHPCMHTRTQKCAQRTHTLPHPHSHHHTQKHTSASERLPFKSSSSEMLSLCDSVCDGIGIGQRGTFRTAYSACKLDGPKDQVHPGCRTPPERPENNPQNRPRTAKSYQKRHKSSVRTCLALCEPLVAGRLCLCLCPCLCSVRPLLSCLLAPALSPVCVHPATLRLCDPHPIALLWAWPLWLL